MSKLIKASIVRAVKLETQIQHFGLQKSYRRTKFYHTASSAAEAYADYMSAKINAQRHALSQKNRTPYVPADGCAIVVGTDVQVPSRYPVHDTAYRRSLKVFKKFLP